MSAQTLIRQACAAGVELRLIDGKLKASGTADALALMVDQLRANKEELAQYLQAANDPELLTDPGAWRELAYEYHAHHFTCPQCIVAGRGERYGQRCTTGAGLWSEYQAVIGVS